MKNIVVATDLSAHADRAVGRAVRLAERLGAKLTLLHAVDSSLPNRLLALHRGAAAENLEEEARANARRVSATSLVAVGDPWAVIAETVMQRKADLLVIGKHHKKRLMDMFRGTTSERVIRTLEIPVLLAVRPQHHHYRNVVAAVDFSVASRRALQVAVSLQPQGTITAVHAYDALLPSMAFMPGHDATRVRQSVLAETADRAGAELDVWLRKVKDAKGRKLRQSLAQGAAVPCLRAAARRNRAELLALGTRGLGAFGSLLIGSVSANLLNDPPCDLLVTSDRGS